MRPSKFTESQIRQVLRQVREGTPAAQVCREIGVTQTTFYRWRRKYEGPPVGSGRAAPELLAENKRLKEIVADLLLEQKGPAGKGR